jgi:glutaredoxin
MSTPEELSVYWQPGCTSCLRVKEYLSSKHIPFRSVNVLADPAGMAELAKLGVRRVPILTKGDQWCDAQTMADINRIAGITQDSAPRLSPEALTDRVQGVLDYLSRYVRQIPQDQILTMLPNRPRSYGGLACHVAGIIDCFLKAVEHGYRVEFEDYDHPLPQSLHSKEALLAYCDSVGNAFRDWRVNAFAQEDMGRQLDLYYGLQTIGEFLERSCWHAGQHLRQLELVLIQKIGITPAARLDPALFQGLPMPQAVWDDQLAF